MNDKKPVKGLERHIEESLFKMDRAEFSAFIAELGFNIDALAEMTTRSFAEADRRVRKQRLVTARGMVGQRVRVSAAAEIKKTFEEKKRLLGDLMNSGISIGGLTFQNRDFKELTEGDVDVILRQLDQLGVLKKFEDGNDK